MSASLIGYILCVIAVIAMTALVLWCILTAQRLNRMHTRLDAARGNLQAALDMRAAVIATKYPPLEAPARAALGTQLMASKDSKRVALENELACAVQAMMASTATDANSDAATLPAAVSDACVRVSLTRRFYNDAVTDTRVLRIRPLVRFFRLGGHAALPEYVELSHQVVFLQAAHEPEPRSS